MTGSGTAADPYIIQDVNDLQAVENDLAAYYELGNNIDASATIGWNGGLGFDPIGTYDGAHPEYAFRGNFDGKGYKIINLFINRPLEDDIGLFGYTGLVGGYGGGARVVQNAGLENCNITGGDYCVAGLIGFNDHGRTITNCWVTGYVTATSYHPGYISLCAGLTGYTDGIVSDCHFSGTITLDDTAHGSPARQNAGLIALLGGGEVGITRCYSTGEIIFNGASGLGSRCSELGGLVGLNTGAPISRCYSTMNITLNDCEGVDEIWGIGGFVGESSYQPISDCYARGSINAVGLNGTGEAIGGFAGYNLESITNCYSTGLVTSNGAAHIGGFCGWNDGGTITSCFWDTETSGQATSDGGTGKTTKQMKNKSTFTVAGWDFNTIWSISVCNDRYPCLLGVTSLCSKYFGNIHIDQLTYQHAERMGRFR